MANKKIPNEDIEWLSQHRQSVERSTRMLKGIKIYAVYFIMAASAFTLIAAIAANISHVYIAIDAIVFLAFAIMSVIRIEDALGENDLLALGGIMSGVIVALIIASLYIAPLASSSQYPISMQVFYPNHPNLTITQNCTGFTTSESGYLNGQPINLTNTTECNLPASMIDNYSIEPFNCNITGKNITCSTSLLDSASLLGASTNITWQGIILNVSKR